MKFKLFFIALPLMAMQSICNAQQFEKNGLPCVAEICLGDGIEELSQVKWDQIKYPHKMQMREMEIVNTVFHGDTKQAAPFLLSKNFDSSAIAPLSRVIAACQLHKLDGIYTTQSGNPTHVTIQLVPNTDNTKQQWTVTYIYRLYPTAVSKEQRAEVIAQLAERYKAFDKGKFYTPKLGEGTYSQNTIMNSFSSSLSLNTGSGGDTNNRLKLHPACGGTKKVIID